MTFVLHTICLFATVPYGTFEAIPDLPILLLLPINLKSVHFTMLSRLIVLRRNHFCLLRDTLTATSIKTLR